jgi:hypothetical protein
MMAPEIAAAAEMVSSGAITDVSRIALPAVARPLSRMGYGIHTFRFERAGDV